ncbi:myb-like protein X [Bactrocera oleae]|uniref:myb-like protein X n=1 Tax=Bactrocera oleae TaxID=104688 RepID=UPI00387E42A3
MALESSGVNITADYVKTKLLQEVKETTAKQESDTDTLVNESSEEEQLYDTSSDMSYSERDDDPDYTPERHDDDSIPLRNITLRPRNIKPKPTTYFCYEEKPTCSSALLKEPETVEDTLSSPKAKEWKEAMDSEYESLLQNNTWTLETTAKQESDTDTLVNESSEEEQLYDTSSDMSYSERDDDPDYTPERHDDDSIPLRNITLRPRNIKPKPTTYFCYEEKPTCSSALLKEPETVEDTLSSPKAKEWKEAMDSEYESLLQNNTWTLETTAKQESDTDTLVNESSEEEQLYDTSSDMSYSERDDDPDYTPERHDDDSIPLRNITLRPRNIKPKPTTYFCYEEKPTCSSALLKEPETVEDTLSSPKAKEWKEAMDSEYESLLQNNTWTLETTAKQESDTDTLVNESSEEEQLYDTSSDMSYSERDDDPDYTPERHDDDSIPLRNITLRPRNIKPKPTTYFCYEEKPTCSSALLKEPETVEDTLSSPKAKEWKEAMDSEYESLLQNNTWTLETTAKQESDTDTLVNESSEEEQLYDTSSDMSYSERDDDPDYTPERHDDDSIPLRNITLRPRNIKPKPTTYFCYEEKPTCSSALLKEPETVEDTLSSPKAKEWKEAMDSEYESLLQNNTWTLETTAKQESDTDTLVNESSEEEQLYDTSSDMSYSERDDDPDYTPERHDDDSIPLRNITLRPRNIKPKPTTYFCYEEKPTCSSALLKEPETVEDTLSSPKAKEWKEAMDSEYESLLQNNTWTLETTAKQESDTDTLVNESSEEEQLYDTSSDMSYSERDDDPDYTPERHDDDSIPLRNITLRPRNIKPKPTTYFCYEGKPTCSSALLKEPETVEDSLSSPKAKEWKEAMDSEYESLLQNNTWTLETTAKQESDTDTLVNESSEEEQLYDTSSDMSYSERDDDPDYTPERHDDDSIPLRNITLRPRNIKPKPTTYFCYEEKPTCSSALLKEPETVEDTLSSPKAKEWKEAMDSEYESLLQNNTWTLETTAKQESDTDTLVNESSEEEQLYDTSSDMSYSERDDDPDYTPERHDDDSIPLRNITLRPRNIKPKPTTYFCYEGKPTCSSALLKEPETVEDSLSSPKAKEWKEAMDSEYESLLQNNTWTLETTAKQESDTDTLVNESSEEEQLYDTSSDMSYSERDDDPDYTPERHDDDSIPLRNITLRPRNIKPKPTTYFCYEEKPTCSSALLKEPETVEDTLSSPKAKEWKEARDSEYESLLQNNTWTLETTAKQESDTDTLVNESSEEEQLYDTSSDMSYSERDDDPDYTPERHDDDSIPLRNITLRPRNIKPKPTTYFCYEEKPTCSSALLKEPETVEDSLSSPKAKEWKEAMDSEYESLLQNNTWTLETTAKQESDTDTLVNESSEEEQLYDTSSDMSYSERDDDPDYTPERHDDDSIPLRNITLRPRNIKPKPTTYFCYEEKPTCSSALLKEPETVEDSLSSPKAKEWKEAMDSEYESLLQNNTWTLVTLPEDKRIIPCKWVYKMKIDANGEVV